MRNWQKHFPDHDVPGFIDFLVDKGVFKDTTTNRDDCPKFGLEESEDEFFVQHPLRSLRERGDNDYGRYLAYKDGKRFDSDDLEEALLHLLEEVEDDEGAWDELDALSRKYAKKVGTR